MAQRTPGKVALPYLADWRKHRQLTMRALYKASGVSPDTIFNLEHGHRLATYTTVGKLAKGLKITPQVLVQSRPEMVGETKGEA